MKIEDQVILEFVAKLRARITAWYLNHEDDYSSCESCGYDDRKPEAETIHGLINETLEEMGMIP